MLNDSREGLNTKNHLVGDKRTCRRSLFHQTPRCSPATDHCRRPKNAGNPDGIQQDYRAGEPSHPATTEEIVEAFPEDTSHEAWQEFCSGYRALLRRLISKRPEATIRSAGRNIRVDQLSKFDVYERAFRNLRDFPSGGRARCDAPAF